MLLNFNDNNDDDDDDNDKYKRVDKPLKKFSTASHFVVSCFNLFIYPFTQTKNALE